MSPAREFAPLGPDFAMQEAALDVALSASAIVKQFGATKALNWMNLHVRQGEVHGLVGANGAGKSTLIKIISGALTPDAGEVRIGDVSSTALSPRRVQQLGLATIYQEPSLAPNLSIAENIVLGREGTFGGVFLRPGLQAGAVESVLRRVGLDADPSTAVQRLSPASRQLVEIAKALFRGAKIIIMDEPTAVLGAAEGARLFKLISGLSANGVSIVYISHHLQETLDVCQQITVMREGSAVFTAPSDRLSPELLVGAMIGREVEQLTPVENNRGEIVLAAHSICQGRRLIDIDLDIHAGEVVGLTGLVGSGRSRLARVLFGAEQPDAGAMRLFGRVYKPANPAQALKSGVCLVPEDRKSESLLQQMSIAQNVTLTRMPLTQFGGVIRLDRERQIGKNWVKQLKIRPTEPRAAVSSLSGGNQQKVAVARSLHSSARLMIFDEPGQGVDIGAKEEILQTIRRLAQQGCAVLVISSDLEELTQVANRIVVMRAGRISGELPAHIATEQNVLKLAMTDRPAPQR